MTRVDFSLTYRALVVATVWSTCYVLKGWVAVRRYTFLSDEGSYQQTVFTVRRARGMRISLSRC